MARPEYTIRYDDYPKGKYHEANPNDPKIVDAEFTVVDPDTKQIENDPGSKPGPS